MESTHIRQDLSEKFDAFTDFVLVFCVCWTFLGPFFLLGAMTQYPTHYLSFTFHLLVQYVPIVLLGGIIYKLKY